MTDAVLTAPPRPIRWKLVLLQLIFAYLVVLRLWFDITQAAMPISSATAPRARRCEWHPASRQPDHQ